MFYLKSLVFCLSFLFCHFVSAGEFHQAVKNSDVERLSLAVLISYLTLHEAVKNGDVERMLDEGYDVNDRDEFVDTPLHNAIEREMYNATEREKDEIVSLLIEAGANVNVRSEYGKTLLHDATWESHEELPCITLLILRKWEWSVCW